jgi:hypothetical protein
MGRAGRIFLRQESSPDVDLYQNRTFAAKAILSLGLIPNGRWGSFIAVAACIAAAFVFHFVPLRDDQSPATSARATEPNRILMSINPIQFAGITE